jgi:hypothetical protein
MQSLDRFVYKVEAIIIFERIFYFADHLKNGGHVSDLGCRNLAVGVRDAKEGRLVCHSGCHCARRDDGRGSAMKGNNDSGWSSDGVVLQLGRRQNGQDVE